MNELWFIPIIGLLGLASTIISSKGSLYDKRFKWYKRLTVRGKIVSAIGLIIVSLSIWQYFAVRQRENQKEISLQKERYASDSIVTSEIKKGVDSNRRQLFNDLSEALSKQSLRLDTVTKSLKGLRDSAKTVIINSPKANPIIILRGNAIAMQQKNDSTTEFKIKMISTQAGCNFQYLNAICEISFTDGTKTNSPIIELISGGILLPKDEEFVKNLTISNMKKQFESIIIVLSGQYSRDDGTGKFKFEEVCKYTHLTKGFFLFDSGTKDKFLKYYKFK